MLHHSIPSHTAVYPMIVDDREPGGRGGGVLLRHGERREHVPELTALDLRGPHDHPGAARRADLHHLPSFSHIFNAYTVIIYLFLRISQLVLCGYI